MLRFCLNDYLFSSYSRLSKILQKEVLGITGIGQSTATKTRRVDWTHPCLFHRLLREEMADPLCRLSNEQKPHPLPQLSMPALTKTYIQRLLKVSVKNCRYFAHGISTLIDQVTVLRPNRHKTGHFGDVLSTEKLKQTQQDPLY